MHSIGFVFCYILFFSFVFVVLSPYKLLLYRPVNLQQQLARRAMAVPGEVLRALRRKTAGFFFFGNTHTYYYIAAR